VYEIVIASLMGGLLGSAHCVGMCGGFAATIGSTGIPLWPSLWRQLAYSAGRIFTYSFLGAIAGAAGAYLGRYETPLLAVQQWFSLLAGVIMIGVGLSVLGVVRLRWVWSVGVGASLTPIFNHFLNTRRSTGFFLAGLANGFLPCGLVYAFLTKALSVADVWSAMAVMAAFGLGTAPAMIAIGCGARLLAHQARAKVYRVAACFVLVFGVVTVKRAFPGPDGAACHDVTAPAATGSVTRSVNVLLHNR
jgi:hypothetical protein